MNSIKRTLLFLFFFCLAIQTFAQMTKKSESGPFLLKGAMLHTVSHGEMLGDVLIKDGKIVDIGIGLNAGDAQIIDCTNKHLYPGFIDGGTHLGLGEVGSISLTNDYNEIGDFVPQMEALTAVNPNSVSIPITRVNGVTTVIASPGGGRFPGKAALINLHGYTPAQMYAGAKASVLNFPSSGRRGRWDKRSDDDIKKDTERAMKELNDTWSNAILYARIDSAAIAEGKVIEAYNPGMKALVDAVRGKEILMIETNKEEDIKAAINWIVENKVKGVITGAKEGWRAAKELAEAKIPVITGPILDNPGRDYDRYDACYTNAGKMQKAGVKVAIRTNGTENVRNLPFNAGFAAAYGMGKEEALKAITIVPAEIFGVADQLGSIDKGKIANLILTDGDPMEPKTTIIQVFVNGWKVPMESRQTLLYDEFLDRSPGMIKQ